MGWLFGKKKEPRIPFPEPYGAGEDTLQFPPPPGFGKVIEPAAVKEAAGIGEDDSETADDVQQQQPMPTERQKASILGKFGGRSPSKQLFVPSPKPAPLFIKVNVYQRILGELDSLRSDINHLHSVNNHLETSEYNEEKNFENLRRNIRAIHDRLLQIDKTLFKNPGE